MAVEIAPTLELMLHIYSLSREGGPDSERFIAFGAAAADGRCIPGYNPMTGEPVADTISAMIELGAEGIARAVATETAVVIGFNHDVTMYFTVAAPGMWTDRFGTEVEHRLKATRPESILLWFDDEITSEVIEREVRAQTVRLHEIVKRGGRPPETLEQAVDQEGRALALSGAVGTFDEKAARILDEYRTDPSLATMVAFLYGDDDAAKLGYAPLDLTGRTGYDHAIHQYGVKSHP